MFQEELFIWYAKAHFNFLQGYFNNVSEYLRIGPPLYFVVKNYNYRYLSVIIFPSASKLIYFVALLSFFLSYHWVSTLMKRGKDQVPAAKER
jgi:hypothetical protein